MKPIKIVQIGIEHDHAPATLTSLKLYPQWFDLAGVVVFKPEDQLIERERKALEGVKRLTLEEAMAIPQLEAVTVETEERLSVYYAQMALDRGLHVQMDKPGSEDPTAFERMARTAKEKDLTLHLGYMYRYNPAVMRLMEDVKAGKLGEIHSVEAHMSCRHKTAKRQWLDRFEGGMLFFLGCHLIDLVVQLQGLPEEVIPVSTCTGIDGVSAKDFGMAILRYPKGVSFVKSDASEIGGYTRRQLVVVGSRGTVEIKPLEYYVDDQHITEPESLFSTVCETTEAATVGKGWRDCGNRYRTEGYDRYRAMLHSFAQIVRGEKENPWSYEHEVMVHRVLMRACGKDVDYQKKIDW